MADIVNLRQHRKRKARDEKAKKADANRIAFGRSRAERQHSKSLKDMEDRKLAAHRLTQDADPVGGEAAADENADIDPKQAVAAEEKAVKDPQESQNVLASEDHSAVPVTDKTSDSDGKRQSAVKNTGDEANVVSLQPGHPKA